jgi:hypothetical protein
MKLICELEPNEINEIISVLENDGFKKILVNNKFISFSLISKDSIERTFKLYSTDINSEDFGVIIGFNYSEFLEKNYEKKSRYGVSLNEIIETKGSVEESLKKLGWQLEKIINLVENIEWKSEVYSNIIYQVRISDNPHIIVEQEDEENFEVYEGNVSKLWAMGTESIEDLFSGKQIYSLLKRLNN